MDNSNMNSFDVCSYNLGTKVDDYLLLCKHNHPAGFKAREQAFRGKYRSAQAETTRLLLASQASVYCLQEVSHDNRPLITALKEKNFEIIHFGGIKNFDTAVALDKRRFKNITNHSIITRINKHHEKDIAIATATDSLTGQKVTFVSAHAPGFNFTQTINQTTTQKGDDYCQKIAKKLSEIGQNTIQIIGSDMNANPEKWNPRFKIFSNQGFQTQRTNLATNVNPRDSHDQEREIDFFFTKGIRMTLWQRIKSIFVSTFHFNPRIKFDNTINFDETKNASDHLPIFMNVAFKKKTSKIKQLWHLVF